MDILSISSTTTHCSFSPRFSLSSTPEPPSSSANLRRPNTNTPLETTTPAPYPSVTPPSNPLKTLKLPQHTLTPKLRLTSKLSPPPPPPPPRIDDVVSETNDDQTNDSSRVAFPQPGKIFIGNLPLWAKKPQITEFFRQFGTINNVILIKGHHEFERNLGFGFVVFDAEESALKAVEFDGVEFHGRVLSVRLDDGRRLRLRSAERERWVQEGGDGREFRSVWHQERDGSRREFRRVLESQPENWQAVVRAFERINKVSH